jgi:lipoate-protein ligase A
MDTDTGQKRSEVLKREGGKLLKVSVWSTGGTIKKVKISGDFFIHPEEIIENLEGRLSGQPVALARETVSEELTKKGVKAIGFNLEDLISMIERCAK